MKREADPRKLRRNVEFALANGFEPDELVPMVEALARASERGTPDWLFAHQKLAELLVEKDPWRAALAASAVTSFKPDDDAAHALRGLSLTLLGHYRSAAKSYRSALALSPDNPSYAHNLGHLLDVALDAPRQALPLLRKAHESEPHVEIAASLAHALGRLGRVAEAKRVLWQALGESTPSADHAVLLTWLDRGAPPRSEAEGAPRRRKRRETRQSG